MMLVVFLISVIFLISSGIAQAAWWSPYYNVGVTIAPFTSLGAKAKVIIYASRGYYGEKYTYWTFTPKEWSYATMFYNVPKEPARIRVIFADGKENNIYPYIYHFWYKTLWYKVNYP